MKLRNMLAGLVVMLGSAASAMGQVPQPADMLNPKLGPKFEDVSLTTPTAGELKLCTVDLLKGDVPNSSAFQLKDGKGQILRKYANTTGKKDAMGRTNLDTWSYYKDGVEVYREFDSTGTGKGIPNNFRWLNGGGMKWGIGGFDEKTKKWTIDTWRMISADEVAFEAFQAAAKGDYPRMQALLITEAEAQALKIPAAKITSMIGQQKHAPEKFAAIAKTVRIAGVKFDAVETSTPQCDTSIPGVEVIKHMGRAVRYSINEKQHGWMPTGEMIKVNGMAWRLVDGIGEPIVDPLAKAGSPELDKLYNALAKADEVGTKLPTATILKNDKDVEAYYRERVALVLKIIPIEKETDQETWYKQLFDNLTAQAQNTGSKATMDLLAEKAAEVAKAKPRSNLAAYGAYREMWTRYAVNTAKFSDNQKEQSKHIDIWLDDLSTYIERYTKADDHVEAMVQFATGCEYSGKTEKAKAGYKAFCDAYPNNPMTPRMKGSLDRLNLVGNELKLVAPRLDDPATTFDVAKLKGKVVVVHYWSTSSTTHLLDLAALKQIIEQASPKANVELVCVTLDDSRSKARDAVTKSRVQGIHLFGSSNNASGMNSPAATQYGIQMLPTLFMIGRDGRVTNNALQIADIETELKKVQ